LPEKFLCDFCLHIFSHKDHEDLIFDVASRKDLHVFICKRWVPFFKVKQRWAPFLLGFSGILTRFLDILLEFLTNQNLWGCKCTPAFYTTVPGHH